jgi:drug/metabolite transporter (DMT)-like permease
MYRGVILLMLAEFCFAAATVFAKFVTSQSEIPAVEITFFRFFFGIFLAYAVLRKTGSSFTPNNKKFVIWRGILNTIAVILFFTSVKYTTVTNANMLNMTYPVFIFMLMPFIGNEKIKPLQIIYLIMSITGVYLVIQPNFDHLIIGDLIGLVSGMVGGFSVMTLRKAREYDSTVLIIFYLMAIGTVINGSLLITVFKMPNLLQSVYIVVSALLGLAGQVFITSGYKYIEANKGSIISSSRIIFAVFLGLIFFNDRLNLELIIGGALILFSVVQLTLSERKLAKTTLKFE